MNQVEQLQKCIDVLAQQHVPELAGVTVKASGAILGVWSAPHSLIESGQEWTKPAMLLEAGAPLTVVLWLGCVALTKCVRPFMEFEPQIVRLVTRSALQAGVL